MARTFEQGDVVELKSGGPAMTVASVGSETGKVFCYWFNQGVNGEWTRGQAEFPPETLKKLAM